jgi:hypothetical protein
MLIVAEGTGMSMICRVVGLSPAQIAALRTTPSLASDLARVTQDGQLRARLDDAMKRMPPERKQAIEAQYRASIEAMPGAKEAQARLDEARGRLAGIGPFEQALDLEKSWHMLHYLVTGHTDASNAPGDALLTGEPLGEDLGYGPARLHDETETREFGRFLETLDLARLQDRVNFQEMTRLGVYSMPMGGSPDAQYESELRAEVRRYFPLLRDYVVKMSQKQDGLLIWLSRAYVTKRSKTGTHQGPTELPDEPSPRLV